MESFVLKENVLTDDILYLPSIGKVFKGGYIAVVKYYTFQNPWSDREHVKKFRSRASLTNFLKKYGDIDIEITTPPAATNLQIYDRQTKKSNRTREA
jgi:hypothetical protein